MPRFIEIHCIKSKNSQARRLHYLGGKLETSRESYLTRSPILVAYGAHMKKSIFAVLAGAAILATGCVSTVSDSHTFAVSYAKDSLEGRYPRSLDQVYSASVAVIGENGVLLKEYVPHDSTNAVRSLEARVNDSRVFIRVEQLDPKISAVDVQARTKWGRTDQDLVHQLEKEIALKLVAR